MTLSSREWQLLRRLQARVDDLVDRQVLLEEAVAQLHLEIHKARARCADCGLFPPLHTQACNEYRSQVARVASFLEVRR